MTTTLVTTGMTGISTAARPRSLRQVKAQMARLRVMTAQAEQMVTAFQPPSGPRAPFAPPAPSSVVVSTASPLLPPAALPSPADRWLVQAR